LINRAAACHTAQVLRAMEACGILVPLSCQAIYVLSQPPGADPESAPPQPGLLAAVMTRILVRQLPQRIQQVRGGGARGAGQRQVTWGEGGRRGAGRVVCGRGSKGCAAAA
jgi:hypothetical protein